MTEEDILALLALQHTPNIGDITAKKLIAHCGSPAAIYKEKKHKIAHIERIGSTILQHLFDPIHRVAAEKEWQYIQDNHLSYHTFFDADYPANLKQIIDAPIIFFSRGNIDLKNKKTLSIVGTRQITTYGKAFCEKFVEELSPLEDLVIISGFAYGVDIAAHKAAMDNGLQTIACLAHGLDIIYPASHKKYTKDLILDANASSTCEVLSRYLDLDKVSKETATCLYTGLVHDTGVFKYPCTSLETMNLAGKLMEKGVEFNKIIDDSFFARDFYSNKVLAKALLDSKLYFDGKLIISYTTKQILDEYKVDIKSLDGVIDELRNTIGIEVAIYLYQLNEDEYKASLRSKSFVDVSKICESLGGGGHIRAAGCSIQGKIEDIIELLIKKVKVEL